MRARKPKLGQHFLKSQKITMDITEAGDISAGDIVLEIGPGKGILTEALLHKAKPARRSLGAGGKVIAVEKDPTLVEYLKNKFQKEIHEGKLDLIEGDILKIRNYNLEIATSYKLVANIPYYITGEILRKFLSAKHQPHQMVLLVQKEVAKRIIARDGKESILSISVKAYGKPRYVASVPARFFSPPPKVDSAILLIEDISKNFFEYISEEVFFSVVKTGFAHKRKLLINNLKSPMFGGRTSKHGGLNENKRTEILKKVFEKCEITEKSRAEDLRINDWKCLAKALKPFI